MTATMTSVAHSSRRSGDLDDSLPGFHLCSGLLDAAGVGGVVFFILFFFHGLLTAGFFFAGRQEGGRGHREKGCLPRRERFDLFNFIEIDDGIRNMLG